MKLIQLVCRLSAWLPLVLAENYYIYNINIRAPLNNGVKVSVKTDDPDHRGFQICAYSYDGTKICTPAPAPEGLVDLDLTSGPDDEHYTLYYEDRDSQTLAICEHYHWHLQSKL